jgi:hypothetical protein
MRAIRIAAVVAAVALVAAACGGSGPGGGAAVKLTDGKLVIGVINDQSGVYADLSGKNAVEAVNMAIADFKAKYGDNALGGPIEVVNTDHQNKADLAGQKAQEFYERNNADVILDVPTERREEALHQHHGGDDGPHRSAVQQVHVPLRVRHVHARAGHRRVGHAEPGQEVVHHLPELRLRSGHGEVVPRRGREDRRERDPVRRFAVPEPDR